MPSLYDPFGIAAKNSPEKKAKGLLAEIKCAQLHATVKAEPAQMPNRPAA